MFRVPCRDGVLSFEVESAPTVWWRTRTGVPALSDCGESVSLSDVLGLFFEVYGVRSGDDVASTLSFVLGNEAVYSRGFRM